MTAPRPARLTARLATLLAAVLAAVVLVGPSAEAADAAPRPAAAAQAGAASSHTSSLRVRLSHETVAAGTRDQVITALPGRTARGVVTFVLKSNDLRLVHRIVITQGRAVYRPRDLGTGRYLVKVRYHSREFQSTFLVLDSQVVVDRSTFTVPRRSHYADQDVLSGRVVYHAAVVRSGYVDVYLNGDRSGGQHSPQFLGFAGIRADGTFVYESFGHDLRARYGPGVYTFRAFYTPNPSYADYISSNVITVRVT